MLRLSCFIAGCWLAGSLSAKTVPNAQVDACLRAAAAKHGIAHQLLQAIAWQESSFNPSAIRKPHTAGGDSSTDYGLMQINSSWLPTLAKHGVRLEHLFDPCVNADVGAWILASNFVQLGTTWNAVGAYNARTPWKRLRYANGVYDKLRRLEGVRVTTSSLPHAQNQLTYNTNSNQSVSNQQSSVDTTSISNMVVFEAKLEQAE